MNLEIIEKNFASLYESNRIAGLPYNFPRKGYYMIYAFEDYVEILNRDMEVKSLPKTGFALWKPEKNMSYFTDEVEIALCPLIESGSAITDFVFESNDIHLLEIEIKSIRISKSTSFYGSNTQEIKWSFTKCESKYHHGINKIN